MPSSAARFVNRGKEMLLFLSMLPALLYPLVWAVYRKRLGQKRTDLKSILGSSGHIKKYRDLFGVDPDQLFKNSFSLFIYIVPVTINAVGVWMLTLLFFERHQLPVLSAQLSAFAIRLPRSVMAAFIGAFVWGMYDAMRRYRGVSLSPESLHLTWVRMLVAGSLAPMVSTLGPAIFSGGFTDLIAFGLGALPINTLSDWLQGQMTTNLKVSTSPTEPPTLQSLQGTTANLLTALSEADIDSTQDLAYADPLKLFLRTNIPWKVTLDLIDQALLVNYVGDKAKDLRRLGIRGSIELAALYEPLHPAAVTAPTSGNIKIVVARIAELLGEQVDAVFNLIDTCHFDFQVQFIGSLWDGAYGSDAPERTLGPTAGIAGNQPAANPVASPVDEMPHPQPSAASVDTNNSAS